MKWKGYLVFILLSFVAACSQRNGLTPARSDQVSEARSSYFPLSDGAEWVYAAQYFAPAAGVQKGKVVVRVDGTEIINGKTYSRLVTLFSGIPGAMDQTDYYRTAKEGIYIVHGREKNSAEQLYLPFPIEVGKSWTVKGPDAKPGTNSNEVNLRKSRSPGWTKTRFPTLVTMLSMCQKQTCDVRIT